MAGDANEAGTAECTEARDAAIEFNDARDAAAERAVSIRFRPSRTLWVQYGHASECFCSHWSTHAAWKT